ncbi:homoserine dehydrogenase [Ornithinibacillus xuwenensis]|uniref:Homoserine dehydrogenase n=1 Tax=Ornithinibacillus xuwenensis TaxID=3144668 RepID=A0ABU9XFZ6_9BACI
MNKIQVALLGLGTVGKGVYHHLHTHQRIIERELGVSIEIAVIVVKHPEKHHDFAGEAILTSNFQVVLDNPKIAIVFEAIIGKEPAFTYLTKSIQAGKHVITANKEMFAYHGNELVKLANANHVRVGYEATTAGGIPIIQTLKQLFQVNQIRKITGILNGTSNYILTEMRENRLSLDEALQQAQYLGYAEEDPTNDIEGYDAFYKLMILCQLLYDRQPEWTSVKRRGISAITLEDILAQYSQGKRIKHLASVEIIDNQIEASVEPVALASNHPLFAIEGVDNAIVLEGDIVGKVTLSGPGAGSFPTASAMIEDLAIIIRSLKGSNEASRLIESASN